MLVKGTYDIVVLCKYFPGEIVVEFSSSLLNILFKVAFFLFESCFLLKHIFLPSICVQGNVWNLSLMVVSTVNLFIFSPSSIKKPFAYKQFFQRYQQFYIYPISYNLSKDLFQRIQGSKMKFLKKVLLSITSKCSDIWELN